MDFIQEREISDQRSVALFKDQEKEIENLFNGETNGKLPKLVRYGVDLALKEARDKLQKGE